MLHHTFVKSVEERFIVFAQIRRHLDEAHSRTDAIFIQHDAIDAVTERFFIAKQKAVALFAGVEGSNGEPFESRQRFAVLHAEIFGHTR